MKNVIIVFQYVPEETKIAKVCVSEVEFNMISKAHTKLLNVSGLTDEEDKAISYIMDSLEDRTRLDEPDILKDIPHYGQWFKQICNSSEPISLQGADYLIETGMIL